MKFKIVLSIFVLFHFKSNGQAIFQKTFGGSGEDWGSCVEQTDDDGFILSGNIQKIGNGDMDMSLIKTNALGDTLWSKTYGGSQDEICHSVKQTFDGGFILLGSTKSFGAGMEDFYLIKTNYLGDTLWTKTYGEINSEIGCNVLQTADGGYILTGYTYSFGISGMMAIYVIKTSSNGSVMWSKVMDSLHGQFAYSIDQSVNGGFIIGGGRYRSNTAHDCLPLIISIDSLGNFISSSMYYATGNTGFFESVKKSSTGYIASGSLIGCNNYTNYNALLVNLDFAGTPIWSKIVPTNCFNIRSQFGYAEQISSGDYFAVGYRNLGGNSNGLVMKINNTGTVIWQTEFGGNGEDFDTYHAPSGKQTRDGGFILLGNTKSFLIPARALYLVKTDENGNVGCNSTQPTFIFSDITFLELNVAIISLPHLTLVNGGSFQLSNVNNYQSICNSCIPPVRPSSIVGPDDICIGDSITYSVTLDTNVTSYTWILPTGWVGNSTTNTITVFPNQLSGNITVVSHNICSTSSPQILPVTIHLNPPPQPMYLMGDTIICAGTTHEYTSSTSPDASNYSWSIPSNCSDSILNTSNYVSFENNGGVVCVTANNGCGPSPQVCISVNIRPSIIQYSYDTICSGSFFVFPDGSIGTIGMTDTSVFVNSNGCDSSIITNLFIESVDTTVIQSGNLLESPISNAIYQWINCANGTPIGGAYNQQFTTNEPGNYALIITQNNCSDTSSCHHIDSTSVTVYETSKESINIYPNPVSEFLKIVTLNNLHFEKIILSDFLGRTIYLFDTLRELDFRTIPSGVYTLSLYYRDSNVTKIVLVNH